MELSVVLVEMGVGVGRQGWALGDPDPLAVGTSCLRAFNNKDGKKCTGFLSLSTAGSQPGGGRCCPEGNMWPACRPVGVSPLQRGFLLASGGEARDAAKCYCTGRSSQRGVTRP